jgi:antitoxin (DNA-binding transcriptional repressor) of toxin-antitoxin stability system
VISELCKTGNLILDENERVQRGESFLWKDRGRVVAVITPASSQWEAKPWPDLRKRLADARETAKRRAPSASAIIYRERG